MEVYGVERNGELEKLFATKLQAEQFIEDAPKVSHPSEPWPLAQPTPLHYVIVPMPVETNPGQIVVIGLDHQFATSFPYNPNLVTTAGKVMFGGAAPTRTVGEGVLLENAEVKVPDDDGGMRDMVISEFTLDKFIWKQMGEPERIVVVIGVQKEVA